MNFSTIIPFAVFTLTLLLIYWRPRGLHEAIPALLGAVIVFLSGSVSISDIGQITTNVSEAAITIIATMVMALTMESIGFFRWIALKLLNIAKDSGIKLFWLTNLLCFLMTLFLNNDGSILITTPVLILILKRIALTNKQKLPYLISGALIATASSVPIGVSNIVNLISLKVIGMNLFQYTQMIFVPGTLGLAVLLILLRFVFRKEIPKRIAYFPQSVAYSQLSPLHPIDDEFTKNTKWMGFVLTFVFTTRMLLFVASYFGVSVSLVSVTSALILLSWRWYFLKINPKDIVKKVPWHIFVFAFSMYVIVYGLHRSGLTELFVKLTEPIVQHSIFHATIVIGLLNALMSNIFNNHPALMIGTLAITQMDVSELTLKTIYLANIVGSDIGSLLLPTGTLATLIWFHLIKNSNIKLTWGKYLSVTFKVIPATLIATLLLFYLWVEVFFH